MRIRKKTSEFQSQLVDFRIPKSTDLITHFVIPTLTSWFPISTSIHSLLSFQHISL